MATRFGPPAAKVWLSFLAVLPLCAALVLFWVDQGRSFPLEPWPRGSDDARHAEVMRVLLLYGALPRFCVSLLCGACLALAGTVFQQALRNVLAAPNTLGVSAGASLALTLALANAPGLLAGGRLLVAVAGSAVTMASVLLLSWRSRLSPLGVTLAGMVVNLFCSSAGALLRLAERPYSSLIYLWDAGALEQHDWSAVRILVPGLLLGSLAAAALARPLAALTLDEAGARALGVSPALIRLLSLVLGVSLAALVVANAGPIAFVDLAAPSLVRLLGARRFATQLVLAPLLGAELLCLTDQVVQFAFAGGPEWVPTGVATTVMGALVLLWLLGRVPAAASLPPAVRSGGISSVRHPARMVVCSVLLLFGLVALSLFVGASPRGWTVLSWHDARTLLPWRGPRLVAGAAAGAMLAMAGVLLQRTTGNPMAAPELLGIGAGAAAGPVMLAALLPPESLLPQRGAVQALSAGAGALAALLGMLALTRRRAFAPDRVLLCGVALTALINGLVLVCMLGGNPRVRLLRGWLLGSTELVGAPVSTVALLVAIGCGLAGPLCARPLLLLPLGSAVARAAGLAVEPVRGALLLLAALITAASVMTAGPLGFVGLLGPHMARLAGLRGPLAQLIGAGVFGAGLMVISDWVGRSLLFPYQLPAGLVCSLIGGPALIWLFARRGVEV